MEIGSMKRVKRRIYIARRADADAAVRALGLGPDAELHLDVDHPG